MADTLKDHIVATLQHTLEVFEETCQCGTCFQCRVGQRNIRKAIRQRENELNNPLYIRFTAKQAAFLVNLLEREKMDTGENRIANQCDAVLRRLRRTR